MVDRKNHSFTFSSKLRKVLAQLLLFFTPIIFILFFVEYYISTIPTSTKLKKEYIAANSEEIEILFLGSSQMERAINPEYIDIESINLSNSAQTLNENFILLKHFQPKLPRLKVVVIEILFNTLQIQDGYSPLVIHHLNWIDYNTNTFGRKIKLQDNLLYYTHPQYFTNLILQDLNGTSSQKFNKYGFDVNKFDGSFNVINFDINNVSEDHIYIENSLNLHAFDKNSKLLLDFLKFCKRKELDVVIYGTPSHETYNSIRNKKMLSMRDSILSIVKVGYPNTRFLLAEEKHKLNHQMFFNANHLNPKGAKKASLQLNQFLNEEFNF